ncbi:type VI secretion system lipoprotein TssJ [Salinisphaera sp.]|uniref:type VI secretion system lipoprotein TssJ n=1 Tax=Salinisphaera sp. TaxID=1914330 RepID=UPI000C3F3EA0|nr:type VI secretion system lipoprotein TssJ [Salinisphaera sp.]MBS63987.1 type VI secretion system lipoprotein TssJ [Salinisphaera sp.]
MPIHRKNGTLFCCLITSLFAILLLSVSGCSLLPGSDEPKEAPEPIGKFSSEGNEPRVSLKLFAGSNVNLSQYGDPLALLVKLYVLKDKNAFEQADYDTFLDDDRAREALGSDLIEARETLLVPSQTYETQVPQVEEGRYLGVVALFRNPAPERWRFAFDLAPQKAEPVVAGLHACAMTITSGSVVDAPDYELSRLSNVTCSDE